MENYKQGGACRACAEKCGECCCNRNKIILTREEKEFLSLLAATPFLPVCRFVVKSTQSEHLELIALAPVYLTSQKDSLEEVKEKKALLSGLSNYGLITLDYDILLENGDYTVYEKSEVYTYFRKTVYTGKIERPDFLFDTPVLETGSLALSGLGQEMLERLDI
ncbi:MAG: hypothetical protein LBK69_00330 [Syntrophomonadaceae bacterium]|jgi:hypothetical protein|nr:hypothetical protein [Syntrophomonadaceae bacterium]